MAAMIWDADAQAWTESNNVPMRWDADAQARVETTGYRHDNDAGAWTEAWNPVKLVPWSTGSDKEIQVMVNAYYSGYYTLDDIKSVWSVGDTRTISLSAMEATGVEESHVAQDVEMVILDFEHDDLVESVNGKSKALVTWGMKDCLQEPGYMHSNRSDFSAGWNGCKRREWCNSVFKTALPDFVKSLIREVVKKTYNYGHSSYASYRKATTSNDFCFLASEHEVTGTQEYSSDYGTVPSGADGTQYTYYQNSSNIPKQLDTTNADQNAYWFRTSCSEYVSYGNGLTFGLIRNETCVVTHQWAADFNHGLSICACF